MPLKLTSKSFVKASPGHTTCFSILWRMIHSKAHAVPSVLAVPLYIHVYTFFIAMDCDSLTDPANGQVSHSRTTLGQTATYSCNTGYNLMGDSTCMCQAMGWSGSAPTCQGMLSMCTCVYCGANIWVFPSVHVKLSTLHTCIMYRCTRNPLCNTY